MEKETKAVVYSKDKSYVHKVADLLESNGFAASVDNYLGNYIIYVNANEYKEALKFAKLNADENRMGSLNDYAEFRGLLATSLVYVELKDKKEIDKAYAKDKPDYITKLLKDIEGIVPSEPYFVVNGADGCIEILINDKDEIDHEKWVQAIIELIENKYTEYYKRCTACEATGKVLRDEVVKEKAEYEDLFHESMFFDGMFYPLGSNIAPHSDCENKLEEDGYWIGMHSWGGQDFKLESPFSGKLHGSVELYEKMKFSSLWDSETKINIPVKTESSLVDKVEFMTSMDVLNDDECEITTEFIIKRKTDVLNSVTPSRPYPTEKSVRNGIFAFPLEDGEFSGTYKERFVKIANGTRLLHFSDVSPFFEVFEIPENFDFAHAEFLNEYPKVFDDTTYDKEDKDINEIMKYLGEDAKKLLLENQSN